MRVNSIKGNNTTYPKPIVSKQIVSNSLNTNAIKLPLVDSKLAIISFGQKSKQTNIESRNFSNKDYFPSHAKVPDGFKYIGTKSFVSNYAITKKGDLENYYKNRGEQVTVIDSRKDLLFNSIKKDYSEYAKEWEKQALEKKLSKSQRDKFLIGNTLAYIKSLKHSNFIEELGLQKNNILKNNNEEYLGTIFQKKENVCRHNSFLAKLLLEEHNVALGIQSGYIICETGSGNHCWNIYNDKNKNIIPFDTSFINEDCWYFDYNGKPLYENSLPKGKQAEFDVINMQIGDTLLLGLDENENIVTNKTSTGAKKYIAKLHLGEFDNMDISDPEGNNESDYEYKLDNKGNVILFNTKNEQEIFKFSYNDLIFSLKLRASADCINLSKKLNIPFVNGAPDYQKILKHKENLYKIDPTISSQTINSIPDILELEDYDD